LILILLYEIPCSNSKSNSSFFREILITIFNNNSIIRDYILFLVKSKEANLNSIFKNPNRRVKSISLAKNRNENSVKINKHELLFGEQTIMEDDYDQDDPEYMKSIKLFGKDQRNQLEDLIPKQFLRSNHRKTEKEKRDQGNKDHRTTKPKENINIKLHTNDHIKLNKILSFDFPKSENDQTDPVSIPINDITGAKFRDKSKSTLKPIEEKDAINENSPVKNNLNKHNNNLEHLNRVSINEFSESYSG